MLAADFPAPMAQVQELLPSHKLKPVLAMSGMARLSLIAVEYRHIDLEAKGTVIRETTKPLRWHQV